MILRTIRRSLSSASCQPNPQHGKKGQLTPRRIHHAKRHRHRRLDQPPPRHRMALAPWYTMSASSRNQHSFVWEDIHPLSNKTLISSGCKFICIDRSDVCICTTSPFPHTFSGCRANSANPCFSTDDVAVPNRLGSRAASAASDARSDAYAAADPGCVSWRWGARPATDGRGPGRYGRVVAGRRPEVGRREGSQGGGRKGSRRVKRRYQVRRA